MQHYNNNIKQYKSRTFCSCEKLCNVVMATQDNSWYDLEVFQFVASIEQNSLKGLWLQL